MSRRNTFKYIKLARKVCDSCGEEKDISEFRLQWKNADGTKKREPHEESCKRCAMERIKAALSEAGYKVEGTDDDQMHNVY